MWESKSRQLLLTGVCGADTVAKGFLQRKRLLTVRQQDAKHRLHREESMANDQALKLTETWARAASVTSSHERDYFVEAIREMQRRKEAQRNRPQGDQTVEQSD